MIMKNFFALTNTNNQNIRWDDVSTFKHNLLHLEEERTMRQRKSNIYSFTVDVLNSEV